MTATTPGLVCAHHHLYSELARGMPAPPKVATNFQEILEEVWDLHEETDTRAIDNFIVRLRRYLEEDPSKPQILETVRGVGYKFVGEEKSDSD